MDPRTGDPFQEHEKRHILSEALKTSTIPIEKLLNLLLQEGGSDLPHWEYMVLPHGRNLSQCKAAFENLRNTAQYAIPAFPAPVQPVQNANKRKSDSMLLEPAHHVPSIKRRPPGIDLVAGARNIQPKPPNGGSPVSMSTTTVVPAPKRRGRPPKTEVERRTRDAMQRGDVFPAQLSNISSPEEFLASPYTPIAPTPPGFGARTQAMHGSQEQLSPDRQPDDVASKKKRPKVPPKPLKTSPPKQPGESSFSVNPQIPVVRDPTIRTQTQSNIAIADIIQASPIPIPSTSASVSENVPASAPPPASITATSTENQPPAQAVS